MLSHPVVLFQLKAIFFLQVLVYACQGCSFCWSNGKLNSTYSPFPFVLVILVSLLIFISDVCGLYASLFLEGEP
jgi:hypothetical protein